MNHRAEFGDEILMNSHFLKLYSIMQTGTARLISAFPNIQDKYVYACNDSLSS